MASEGIRLDERKYSTLTIWSIILSIITLVFFVYLLWDYLSKLNTGSSWNLGFTLSYYVGVPISLVTITIAYLNLDNIEKHPEFKGKTISVTSLIMGVIGVLFIIFFMTMFFLNKPPNI